MSKKRIYELARELNMQNKQVLEKVKELGLGDPDIKHTSSIDAEIAAKIKSAFQPKNKENSVEKTRIKPNIIRRRKKASDKEPVKNKIVEVKKTNDDYDIKSEVKTAVPDIAAEGSDVIFEKSSPEVSVSLKDIHQEKFSKKTTTADVVGEESLEKPERTAGTEQSPKEKPKKPSEKTSAEKKPKRRRRRRNKKNDAEASNEAGKEVSKSKSKRSRRRRKKDTPAKIIKMAQPPVITEEPASVEPKQTVEDKTIEAEKQQQTDAEKGSKKTRENGSQKEKETSKPKKIIKGKKKKKDIVEEEEENLKSKKGTKKKSFKKKSVVEGKDLYDEEKPRAKKQRKTKAKEKRKKTQITKAKAIKRRIKVDDSIIISELAKRLGVKAAEIIKKLMDMGMMTTVNQSVDFETASLIASEFDYEVENAAFEEEDVLKQEYDDDPEKLKHRPPVVTIMGHVDHGKTSLLDVIRKTNVTDEEAGHITQHIGAYLVSTDRGNVVFLDTPGHEAFTAMRSRGASVTDIVVLVVAADDGVMPQTIEAVSHSKAANVPIIVAINKIDKPNADTDRVQRELADIGLMSEDWGGDTIFVKVSAKKKQGINELLEMILLQSEMVELKANSDKKAVGRVIEAKLDAGRGAVATVLIQEGTLHIQDSVVCGLYYGKLRSLLDDKGKQITSAGPATPVEIIGLSGVPSAGDEIIALAHERDAKQISEHRIQRQRSKELAKQNKVNLENLFQHMQDGETKELNLIIKADVHGSIEALKDSLIKLSNEEVKINIVHSATGTITESDVSLSEVSGAVIIGFNVRPNPKVQAFAAESGVDMHLYNIIYDVINDVQNAILGMMASTFEEHVMGIAEVRQLFTIPKIGTIAGSYVTDGKIARNGLVRLLREGIILYQGKINSLRRFKDDAKEVQSGYECGIGIENYNDIKVGDFIECYYMEEIKPKIG